jgi:hypothetical protein
VRTLVFAAICAHILADLPRISPFSRPDMQKKLRAIRSGNRDGSDGILPGVMGCYSLYRLLLTLDNQPEII